MKTSVTLNSGLEVSFPIEWNNFDEERLSAEEKCALIDLMKTNEGQCNHRDFRHYIFAEPEGGYGEEWFATSPIDGVRLSFVAPRACCRLDVIRILWYDKNCLVRRSVYSFWRTFLEIKYRDNRHAFETELQKIPLTWDTESAILQQTNTDEEIENTRIQKWLDAVKKCDCPYIDGVDAYKSQLLERCYAQYDISQLNNHSLNGNFPLNPFRMGVQ